LNITMTSIMWRYVPRSLGYFIVKRSS